MERVRQTPPHSPTFLPHYFVKMLSPLFQVGQYLGFSFDCLCAVWNLGLHRSHLLGPDSGVSVTLYLVYNNSFLATASAG